MANVFLSKNILTICCHSVQINSLHVMANSYHNKLFKLLTIFISLTNSSALML